MSIDAAQVENGEKVEYDHADKTTTTDSDQEGAAARGAQVNDIPAGYWYSFRFLGSFFSLILVASALFINFNLPVGPSAIRLFSFFFSFLFFFCSTFVLHFFLV